MSRDSSGNYSLPAGNPVVSGTSISSTWANNTLTDLATEMQDSLSRSGKGGMLVALRGTDGTAGAPAFSFESETDSGIYRAASGNIAVSVDGTRRAAFTSGGLVVYNGSDTITLGHDGTNATLTGTNTTNLALTGITAITVGGVAVPLVNDISAFTGGTLADARLSSNVPLLNAANTFTASSPITLHSSNLCSLRFKNDAEGSVWDIEDRAGTLAIRPRTDELSLGTSAFIATSDTSANVLQTALAATVEIDLTAPTLDFNGTVDISGTLTVNSTFTVNSAIALIQSTNNPAVQVWDTDAGEDAGRWAVGRAQGSVLQIGRTLTDSNNGVANGIVMTRSGTSITEVELNATDLDFNGNADISGTLAVGNDITVSRTTTNTSVYVKRSDGAEVRLVSFASQGSVGTTDANPFALMTGGTSRVVVAADGSEVDFNVSLLDINGNADISGTLVVGGAVTAGTAATSSSTTLTPGQVHHLSSGPTIGTAAAGNWVGIYNNSGSSITLTQGTGLTLRLAGTSTTGNRTLASRGLAVIYWPASSTAVVSGGGVS